MAHVGSDSDAGSGDDATLGPTGDDDDAGRPMPKLGETIGRYVLLRPIASGGMGHVWAAWDPELDRNVALKLLLPRRSGPEEREALVQEARSLARLSHANVVHVYDVGTWRNEVWVALELVDGTPLDRWVKSRVHGWSAVLDVLIGAGRGLFAAHTAGLAHLDVKPGNVVVGNDGVARVLDFGLARRVEPDAPVSSASWGRSSDDGGKPRAVVGTIGYIAPELFVGCEPDERCDQFGFCVTAWEALAGVRPFPGRHRHEYERTVLEHEIAEPPAGTRVPARVLRVLRRGLARRPEQRWPDMGVLLAELERARVSLAARIVWPTALTAAATIAVAVSWPRSDPPPACDGGAAEFATVWDPARRAAVERAFGATGEPYAASAWTSVASGLDGYGERWAAARDAACVAAASRADAAEIDERRAACLDGDRLAVAALVEVFVAADRGVVEKAAAAVRALADPDVCNDPEHLLRTGTVPENAAFAARLAQARALHDAHRVGPAVELARAIAAEAEAGQVPAVAAQAHFVAGRSEALRGAIEPAVKEFHAAIWAAEAAGDDQLRADAFAELVYVDGHLGHHTERAHWYARAATEVMTRIGATSGPRSVLQAHHAIVLADEGRYAEATARYREAIALRLAGGFGADEVFSTLLNNLGSVYLAQSDHGAAAAWFSQAYLLRLALSGADHPDLADVLVNQGNVLQWLGEDKAALEHFERAIGVLTRTRGADDPGLRVAHNDIAVVLAKVGRRQEALVHYRESLRLWRMLDPLHPMSGVVLYNIAHVHVEAGELARALAVEREALNVLRRAWPSGHPYVAAVLVTMGRTELELGHSSAAIVALRAAMDMLAHVEGDPEVIAEADDVLARALAGRDRGLARTLAARARRGYEALGDRGRDQIAELDRFWAD